ncbi:preprotein translocase subunit SecA [Candidatus Kaiserbacteria bacterium RIFCSPHIGHO2_02_FULL_50_50]|uniref:Protein translocase subunit SecA n=1 Tax=Candidatus Kaiserbacteria bacterium RIFCSPHIGHO2_02_FULL_50_50 TaxID=1798492 RepID=A0A1F6DE19_9BACT|nr:MAG: preprotein translocase subunit SecA [Candidatus Kaiserbacteria bacterium RIFCSPHIGHO2_02_FULL_50_50]OGG88691.1 MAG: preprotein translocase subunit SecA [Candidatus Kaiserbacteria bacterium RIFCSPLOWO2_12_FULL_50_10]
MAFFLEKFFGPSYEKELKKVRPLVAQINDREEFFAGKSGEELVAHTQELKDKVVAGTSLDDVLVDAFALVREAAKRTLGLRHYDVQLIGGIMLHEGKIAEMRTGEGKTLVGTLPAFLNALAGKGVHVVTVNDYLARRDAVWMGQIYAYLGLSVGIINHDTSYLYDATQTTNEEDEARDEHGDVKVQYEFMRPCTRKEAYAADITYGTNNEYGFDYLRDNIEFVQENVRQRGHFYAMVDEVDSILIDEARTPLIISAPAGESDDLYGQFAELARQMTLGEDYEVEEKHKSATLTEAGITKAEQYLNITNIYTLEGMRMVHHLENAVKAKALYTRDKEYVVRGEEIVIVDEFTGRLQPGRRWSEGLHQAIEAKEGVPLQKESKTFASITFQNYFRMYDKLAGMTGTGLTSQEEFYAVYKLDVIPIPTHNAIKRVDKNDLIFQSEQGKLTALVRSIKEINATGQPILIGTASIDKNQEVSIALSEAGVAHTVLNAKNHEHEGEIIANAGRKGAVTLATNMAGRGVDIKLGGIDASKEEQEEVKQLGGLYVIGTERHEARRIDNQLRGRAGRQGDHGTTQFYVSMEDSLMRVFASDVVKKMMGRLGIPEDEAIENSIITKSLESAQTRIEGFHFDSRKQVLAYDDVLNKHRQALYGQRRHMLAGDAATIDEIVAQVTEAHPEVAESIAQRKVEMGDTLWYDILRRVALQTYDHLWVEHLEVMQYARSNVSLRAYGQQDPLVEYRKEGQRLYQELQRTAIDRLATMIPTIRIERVVQEEEKQKATLEKIKEVGGGEEAAVKDSPDKPVHAKPEFARNESVTIVNPNSKEEKTLKFKKAEPFLEEGWKLK